MTPSFTLDRPIRVRKFGEAKNLVLELRPGEAPGLLHLLLAIDYGIFAKLRLAGSDSQVRVIVAGGAPDKARAVIRSEGLSWFVDLSSNEIQYWCRFLLEVVMGVVAVDHIDVDAASLSLTLRVMAQVIDVNAEEARRRLGL